MPTGSNAAPMHPEPKFKRLRLLVLALYLTGVTVTSWCYFVVPAPERWRFIRQYLENWQLLFKP